MILHVELKEAILKDRENVKTVSIYLFVGELVVATHVGICVARVVLRRSPEHADREQQHEIQHFPERWPDPRRTPLRIGIRRKRFEAIESIIVNERTKQKENTKNWKTYT